MNDHVQIYIVANHPQAQIPVRAHPHDAGWDLFVSRDISIPGREARDVHTDISIALPPGWFANIKGRSSTLVRYGLQVIEGIIDQGYRGELFIQVLNTNKFGSHCQLMAGMRIAQLLVLPVPDVTWMQVNGLPNSPRGTTGFGQSGK